MSTVTPLHTELVEPQISASTETFITSIHINKVREIENFQIDLSDTGRKHLIVTGRNGSGKTSFLQGLNYILSTIVYGRANSSPHEINVKFNRKPSLYQNPPSRPNPVFLLLSFDAHRRSKMLKPTGIRQILQKNILNDNFSDHFLQYIVNLKAERSFARDDDDQIAVQKIDKWFETFEDQLKTLFEAPSLKLVFDRKRYTFSIQIDDRQPFTLTELSDGYSSVLAIITEIILQMENSKHHAYDQQGIILIDEIETHLHVDLQKQILPFLCDFFPKIQFIVATHSPFVLQSATDTVICDLEKRIITSDLSGYSSDTLIESYFESDKYSDVLKKKLTDYEHLALQSDRSGEEEDLYQDLKIYFDALPKYSAPELHVKLQQIKLQQLAQEM